MERHSSPLRYPTSSMIAQKLPTLVLASMKVMDADYERR